MPMNLIDPDTVDFEFNGVVDMCSQDPARALKQAVRLKFGVRVVEIDDRARQLDQSADLISFRNLGRRFHDAHPNL